MPVITFPYEALAEGLARGARRAAPDRAAVVASLAEMGCALDGPEGGPQLSVEALMNRPDLFAVEGIARALRSFLGVADAPHYPVSPGPVSATVDPAVLAVRPAFSAAVVRGVDLTDASLRLLLDAQEKLDHTYGRRRARVSIGLHDLAPLTPPITYTAVAPSAASFVPLFADALPGGPRAMDLADILANHPKGQAYAHILAGAPAYPLLRDARGTVLSFPPIINGVATELKPGRRDLFLDVTGTSTGPVSASAALLAMLLAERGGRIESVTVSRPGEAPAPEPRLAPARREVSLARASALVGLALRADEAAGALERLGHTALIVPGGRALEVHTPPWRFDVLHEVDLIEDIAIGLGYRNVPGSLPRAPTIGTEWPSASAARRARAALLGLGFLEVVTLTLGPAQAPSSGAAAVENPITADHSALRTSLLPSLLQVAAANTHRDLPQAIFEVGDCVAHALNRTDLALLYIGADASFTRAKGVALALLAAFGLEPSLAPLAASPLLAPGRAASLSAGGPLSGAFGELSPSALLAHGIAHPAFALEIPLAALAAAPPAAS